MCLLMLVALTGCFTGVENTPKITEKDVSRTMSELERRQPSVTLTQFVDSLALWRRGKQFYVADNQVRMIFASQPGTDMDSVSLAGKMMTFIGRETVIGLDNREVINLRFACDGREYIYRTGKTIEEFGPKWSIPLLIDMDMVSAIATQIQGKDPFIKTPLWYDPKDLNMIHGRQYIKVHIDSVVPGNKVLPLKVMFTASDNGQHAFVWMTTGNTSISNRDYDSLFTGRDVHDNYPDIGDEHWKLIVNGDVAIDMTKEECRLSKGAPKTISRQPNQAEVREYWYYDGGSYLQFVDGLLKAYRK